MKNSLFLKLTVFFILAVCLLSACVRFYQPVYNATHIDSVGHFLGFFILAWGFNVVINVSLQHTFFCLFIYAVASEVGQFYLGFRNGELRDVIADLVGVLLFISLKSAFNLVKRRRDSRVTLQ